MALTKEQRAKAPLFGYEYYNPQLAEHYWGGERNWGAGPQTLKWLAGAGDAPYWNRPAAQPEEKKWLSPADVEALMGLTDGGGGRAPAATPDDMATTMGVTPKQVMNADPGPARGAIQAARLNKEPTLETATNIDRTIAPAPQGGSGVAPIDLTTSQVDTQNAGGKTNQRALFVTPEEFQSLLAQGRQVPGIPQAENSIDQMNQYVQDYATQPGRVDLSPLLALADSETGSKLLSGYHAPPSREQRQQQLLSLQDLVGRRQRELSNQLLEAVGRQKVGLETDTNKMIQTQRIGSQVGMKPVSAASGMADLRMKEKDVRDTLNKTLDPMETRLSQLQTLHDALNENNLQLVGATLSIIAKQVGADAGMLSNQDIQRTMPATLGQDIASVVGYLTSNPQAKLDPKITSGLRKLVGIAVKRATERYTSNVKRKKQQYKASQSFSNVPVDDIFAPADQVLGEINNIGASYIQSAQKAEKPAPKAAPKKMKAPEEMSLEELQKELGK